MVISLKNYATTLIKTLKSNYGNVLVMISSKMIKNCNITKIISLRITNSATKFRYNTSKENIKKTT